MTASKLTSKRLTRILLAVGLVSMVAFIVPVGLLVLFGQKWGDDYAVALRVVKSSPAVIADVGEPINDGLWVWSVAHSKNNRVTSSDHSIPISGPRGRGRASVTTVYSVSGWSVAKATWTFNGTERTIYPVPAR